MLMSNSRPSGELATKPLALPAGFEFRLWPTWKRGGDMEDLLYRTSLYGPPRPAYTLPWGDQVFRRAEINYHFYNVADGVDRAARIARAVQRMRNSGLWITELKEGERDRLINDLLLGVVQPDDLKGVLKKNDAERVIAKALETGELSASLKNLFSQEVLPFRQSPLEGKSLLEIAKSPVAITVALAVGTQGNPVALIFTPVGVVAMHVAMKAGPRVARWVDNKLKEWLED